MSESDSNWLDTAIDGLTQFDRNVTTLLDSLNNAPTAQAGTSQSLDEDITALEASSGALCGSLGKLLEVVIPRISEEINSKNEELENLRVAYRNYERLLASRDEKIRRLESDLSKAKDQALSQFESISWIGSTMGALLWKACKQRDSVRALVGTDNLQDFLPMANCVLDSYVASLNAGIGLSADSEDYKFMAAIFGTLVNLAAHPEGRQYLAGEVSALGFATNALSSVNLFRAPDGRWLRRMTLTYVYNICLEETGVEFMMTDRGRLQGVVNCLTCGNAEDVLILAVNLLLMLIKAMPEARGKVALCQMIPKGTVKQLALRDKPELKEPAAYLLQLIEFDWMRAAGN
ncbi:uncharacterized protein LOC120424518 isoform X2 [Culex pipiens pallens]|uniref:uncharacterized protein LOC120424518 isoform X2 n=1 Tax=Culex pipiens pallens TaxID=42434 RepID=UPI001952FFF8|nr:uncharacterized protein LOC120424518 isoform X2 [Culex pipiens pallens]